MLIKKGDCMKTLTYGMMHFFVAFVVSYVVTGSVKIAGTLAIIEPLVQTFAYYFHERVWSLKDKEKKLSLESVI
jgi:hypothetical protein